jgi:rhodanese-related sulfurtransferase
MGILSSIFGKSTDLKEVITAGATIIDVRSSGEFQGGNVNGSINIPLDKVEENLDKIKSLKTPIILCCASGNRSGQALRFLQSKGIDCLNGGGWTNVNAQI